MRFLNSHLRQNTPTTMACRSGWREQTTGFVHFAWNGCSSADTRFFISEYGTGTRLRTMFVKCCLIQELFLGLIYSVGAWRKSSTDICVEMKTIPMKFTSS